MEYEKKQIKNHKREMLALYEYQEEEIKRNNHNLLPSEAARAYSNKLYNKRPMDIQFKFNTEEIHRTIEEGKEFKRSLKENIKNKKLNFSVR